MALLFISIIYFNLKVIYFNSPGYMLLKLFQNVSSTDNDAITCGGPSRRVNVVCKSIITRLKRCEIPHTFHKTSFLPDTRIYLIDILNKYLSKSSSITRYTRGELMYHPS